MMAERLVSGPVGVGGWLGFRIIELLLLTPFAQLIFFNRRMDPVSSTGLIAIVLLGCVAGLLLLLKVEAALRFVGIHLAACVTYALWHLYFIVARVRPKHFGVALVFAALGLAMYLAWFLYFRKSVRVRNTFGRNL